MMKARSYLISGFLLIAMAVVVMPAPSHAQIAPDALVQELSAELHELIQENRELYTKEPQLLKAEADRRMRLHMDTEYAARLVLGRHGRGLASEQVQRFAHALASNLMDQYATRLLDLDSQNTVEVLPLEPNQDPRRTRVRTRLRLDNGSLMPIDFVMRQTNGDWLLFDVIVEGISYVATYRTQIGEQINALGFEAMLEELEQGQVQLESNLP